MDASAIAPVLRLAEEVTDPRRHNRLHPLPLLIVMAVIAVLCGADGWEDVGEFVRERKDWFKTFLDLPRGVPSHDTFKRVFARLKPEQMESCLRRWLAALGLPADEQIIFDGKSLRRSFEQSWNKSDMAHIVSAFAATHRVVLAQQATAGKGGEIATIEALLKTVELKGATVTIDAIGCQKSIATSILEHQGQYILAVKDNQPTLHSKLAAAMDEAILEDLVGWEGASQFEQSNGGHGRIETRRVWCTTEVTALGPVREEWPGIQALVAVERRRQIIGKEQTVELHYFIASDAGLEAQRAARMIRGHWAIENSLHYVLDVSFDEDQSRVRKGHGAENLSRLRRVTANLLQLSPRKASIRCKRKLCCWSEPFLIETLLRGLHPADA
ncbi:MAG TPA: ISAs1 family transposase [Bryobacteraceae bacterium]|nr:ISAs1 family transposase [Bryobacteraceae bacterium]